MKVDEGADHSSGGDHRFDDGPRARANRHMRLINGARRRQDRQGVGNVGAGGNNTLTEAVFAGTQDDEESITGGGGFLGKRLGKLKLPMGFGPQ